MLERARLIDTANQWAKGTLTTYQSKFRVISDFERSFRLPVLQPTGLRYPPNGPAIRLMWVQERYSLYPAEWSKKSALLAESVKFGTVRGKLWNPWTAPLKVFYPVLVLSWSSCSRRRSLVRRLLQMLSWHTRLPPAFVFATGSVVCARCFLPVTYSLLLMFWPT
jgi:hypothetical protein